MTRWRTQPGILTGKHIRLVPFEDSHIPGLKAIAFEERIWKYLPNNVNSEREFEQYIDFVKSHIAENTRVTFTIMDKFTEEVLGSTSYLNFDDANKKLEIGHTWLAPKVWGTKVNPDAKYLLLDFCFEQNDINRVEIRTRDKNFRSQKAIEKIGGIKEGTLRMIRIDPDGLPVNAVLYSIIRPEWESVKMKLLKLIE